MGCLRIGASALAVAWIGVALPAWAQDGRPGPCDRTNWLGQRVEPGPDYAGSRDALLDLMAMVPNTEAGRSGTPMVSYIDFDAMVAAGLHKVAPDADMGSVPLDDALMTLMRAQAGPQEYMQYIHVARDSMVDVIGVGPVDIRRGLDFGKPPVLGMMLGLNRDADFADAIGAALAGRDFGERMVHGVPVWHNLDDNQIDIANRLPEDPFWGSLGRSERLFEFEGVLAGAPAWAMAEAMVGAAIDKDPSLIDDPTICAVAAAATDQSLDGELLQFLLINPQDVMFAIPGIDISSGGDSPSLELAEPAAQPGDLPPYRIAAFADRFTGERDEALIALAYRDADTAAAAGAVLAERLQAFRPTSQPETWQRLLTDFNAEISSEVIAPTADGPAVALVRVRYDSQFPTDETDDGLRRHGGRLFATLMRGYYIRDLTFLVATMD